MFDYITGTVRQDRDSLLRDGTPYRIRPIGVDDRHLMLACFERLSPESRRSRFFAVKPALSESDLAFLTSADGFDHLALGAIRLDARGEEVELLGAARCIRLGADSDSSELALAVADKAQGQGVGRLLLTHLTEDARARGIRRFRCEVLATNDGMRALLAGPDSRVSWLDNGTLEYDYFFPEPQDHAQTLWPYLVDPLFAARLGADAWASVQEQILDDSFSAGKTLLGFWVGRWPIGSCPLSETIAHAPRPEPELA